MASVLPSVDTTLKVRAKCHCGLASYTCTIPTSAVPLKSAICSCTSCRRATGQLFATFVVIPGLPVPDVSALDSYASSTTLTRFFCPRCGASVINQEDDEWEFAVGMLDIPIEGLLDRQALFADDSADGGGYLWLPEKNGAGREIKRHGGHRTSDVVDVEVMRQNFESGRTARVASSGVEQEEEEDGKLHVSCHCGAFQCYITRPLPDAPPPTPKNGKWWLSRDGQRYQASLDACTSCRKVTGFDVIAWAYIPAINYLMPDGSPVDPMTHPALKHYDSSPGTHRDFCGTCGAPVFFRRATRDPQVWDVMVGLFKGEGARAENWLEWRGLSFEDDALDPEFVAGIVQGMKKDGRMA
jgi:hypothetical protein